MKKKRDIPDLSDEMLPDQEISPRMRALLEKERESAKQRIIARGIVHFRADREFMEALFTLAEQLKTAPGTLCRRIVWEHLQQMRTAPTETEAAVEIPMERRELFVRELVAAVAVQVADDMAAQLKQCQESVRYELAEIKARLPESGSPPKPSRNAKQSLTTRSGKMSN